MIEKVNELLPKFHTKFPFAFIQKTINFGNILVFVITSEQTDHFRIFDFVSHKETNSFYAACASVHVVS